MNVFLFQIKVIALIRLGLELGLVIVSYYMCLIKKSDIAKLLKAMMIILVEFSILESY